MKPGEIEKLLQEFGQLTANWDSYGAEPITEEAIDVARTFTKRRPRKVTAIVPLSDGGIQVEWLDGANEVETEIDPEGQASHWKVRRRR